MTIPTPPYVQNFDLFTLSEGGNEKSLKPPAPILAAIAEWAGVATLHSLEAKIRVHRAGENAFRYVGHLKAELDQNCVVTMEPVRETISRDFERTFVVVPRRHSRPAITELSKEDLDEAETVDSPVVDLAAPVLEELALAIDPYPRARGAVFEAPPGLDHIVEPSPRESPFAVLGSLKSPKSAVAGKPRAARKK